jgi:hypothetical protein
VGSSFDDRVHWGHSSSTGLLARGFELRDINSDELEVFQRIAQEDSEDQVFGGFNDWDLYLMGALQADEVVPQTQWFVVDSDASLEIGQVILKSNPIVREISIHEVPLVYGDIVSPYSPIGQKKFNIAFVVIS